MDTIETTKVTRFAKRQAALRKSEKLQKELRDEIISRLVKGAALPENGPYVLELAQNGGSELDWQEEYFTLVMAVLASKKVLNTLEELLDIDTFGLDAVSAFKKAEEIMKRKRETAPPKPSIKIHDEEYVGGVKLSGKVNPQYRVKARVA